MAAKKKAAKRKRDVLGYSGGGKISVPVNSIVNSPKVQRQVRDVREIAGIAATKRKRLVKRSTLSFSEGVRHEIYEVFRLHPDYKGRYSHLKTLGTILKTRALGTRRRG